MAVNQRQIDRAVSISKKFGATQIILFGSTLDKSTEANDLDLACDGVSGWNLYKLGAELEKELHIPVDIIPLSQPTKFTLYIKAIGKRIL